MSTVPSSRAKVKPTAKGGGVPGAAAPDAGVSAGEPAPTRSRRPPFGVLALLGVTVAVCYGHFVLAMRFGPPLVMVGLGGLTLTLAAAALWRVIDPLTRGETVASAETRAPHRLRELEREKQTVLKAIKEIELDYQMRKISEFDYREMVERYRARALRIMGDLAVGDDYRALIERELKDRVAARAAAAAHAGAATVATVAAIPVATPAASDVATTVPVPVAVPAPSAGHGCLKCGTRNDSDAQFCKKCGAQLTSSTDPAA